jgi:hypothetical protein
VATNIGGNKKKIATFLQKPKFVSFFWGKKTRHPLKNIQIFGGGRHGAKIHPQKKKKKNLWVVWQKGHVCL